MEKCEALRSPLLPDMKECAIKREHRGINNVSWAIEAQKRKLKKIFLYVTEENKKKLAVDGWRKSPNSSTGLVNLERPCENLASRFGLAIYKQKAVTGWRGNGPIKNCWQDATFAVD